MTRKLPRLLIAPVLCFPMGTFALGIGQIEVNSALNQILDAEIPLLSPEETELAGLSASLASSAIFAQYAIERSSLLSELEFSVQTTEDGRSFIKVTSKQPIREPLLNFLVQLEWPKGQLVREFTVLLDLPATPIKPLTSPSDFAAEPISATSPSAKVENGLVVHRGDTFYGPVARGEVLWDIAAKVRPDASISRQRMMEALLEANPEAFWKPHIDGVLAGAVLRIPSAQEIAPAQFSAEVSQQLAKRQANLTPVSNGQPAQSDGEETFQVKLVPPDVSSDMQPQSTLSRSATTTSQSVEPVAVAVLPADFRIKLKDNQPQLSIAGLAAVRSRIGALTQDDKKSPTLAQEQENASAMRLQSTTTANDAWQPLESDATEADDAIFEPQVAQKDIMDDVLSVTPEGQQNTVDTAKSQPETAFPQTVDDLSFALPNLETQLPELVSDSQPESVLPSAMPNSAKSQWEMPESTSSTTESDESLVEDQPNTSGEGQNTTSEAAETTAVTQPDSVISPPESTPVTPPAAHQQPPGILTGLFENLAHIAILGFLLLLLVTAAFLMVRRAKRSEEKEALAFEAIIPDDAPAQKTADVSSNAERSGTTPNIKPAKPFRATPNPLERADLLLAVGNHAEAENLIRLALTEDLDNPALRVKLLDIYFASGNAEGFLKEAEMLGRQLDGETSSLWEHVVQMGRKLYPSHALFNTTASFTSKESSATSGEGLSEDNNQAGNKIAINSQFTDLDFNAFMGDDKTAEVAPSENNGSSTGLDGLDWKLPDVEPPTLVQQPTKNKSGDKDNQASEPHTMTQDLDWELPDIEPPTVVSEKPSENQLTSNNENASQAKLGGFEFNEFSAKAEDELDDPLTLHNMSSNDESDSAMRQVATEKESFEERLNNVEIELERLDEDDLANEKSDEDALGTEEYIETKLDLAMAYLDMGDAVGARNLLEEVLQEGNADQKQRAEAFMAKLA